jgi:DNA-binding SARP family transcriptional activator
MIRVLTLGQCAIELDGTRVSAESELVFGLLLYLAARAGMAVSRDEAQALLWPDLSHTRGRHCLRQAAYRLRQLGVPLRSDNSSLSISLGDVTSDYAILIAEGAPAVAFSDAKIGEVLPSYLPTFSAPYAAWVEEYRARLTQRIRHGLVRAIVDLRSKGRYREAEPLARVCLTSDPFNEVATLTLAEATAVLGGNRAEALAILDRYVDEVGSSPDRRLALSASVLRRRISERFVEQRYAAPPDPPFVGREDVLELMVEKMQESVAGRSKIVYLWGEPGIGKTRLLEELSKVAHVQGVRVERYTVSPNDPERPLALFSSILPRMMRMTGAVGISPDAYEAIQRFVDPSAWERVDPPRTAAEAALVFGRLKSGICELFEALADERAMALLVDDVHWCDERSLEVLSEVVEHVRERRVAFVLTSRESCSAPASRRLEALCARAAVRRLDGLNAGQVETLLAQIAEQRNFALTSEFVRRTVDTSAGNPLFVSELATHYGWNGVRDDLPHNMQTLLQKRLDALSPGALLVFQACAVLGEHATVERIRAVLQTPTHSLLHALLELEGACLLGSRKESVLPRHDLLCKEAGSRLTPLARQALYSKAATVLQRTALKQVKPTMCWHAVQTWIGAGYPDRALQLVTTMAHRLIRSGLTSEADGLLQRARELIGGAAAASEILPLQWRAAHALGHLERSFDLAVECQELNKNGLGASGENFAEFAAFDASRVLGARRRAVQMNFDRLERGDETPDVLSELATRLVVDADDFVEPETAHRAFAALNRQRILERTSAEIRAIFEVVYHSHFGRLEIAIARAREIVSTSQRYRIKDPMAEARRLRWAHRPFLLAGRLTEARNALDQSVLVARSCGSRFDEALSRVYRADTLVASNDFAEAARLIDDVEQRCPSLHGRLTQHIASSIRAEVGFGMNNADDLSRAIRDIEAEAHLETNARNLIGVDASRVLEQLLHGRQPDALRVERLARVWDSLQSIGSADLAFVALVGAYLLDQLPDRATIVWTQYRRSRRERLPLSRGFAEQLSRLVRRSGMQAPDQLREVLGASGA